MMLPPATAGVQGEWQNDMACVRQLAHQGLGNVLPRTECDVRWPQAPNDLRTSGPQEHSNGGVRMIGGITSERMALAWVLAGRLVARAVLGRWARPATAA